MKRRLVYSKVLPEGMKFMNDLDDYSQNCGLEPGLLDLIKLRASQINAWNRFTIFGDPPGSYQPPIL